MLVLHLEVDREEDGRWLAEVIDLPGVLCYGETEDDARRQAIALTFRVLADRAEHGELEESSLHQLSLVTA
ncbi:MAG: type II toxin-antitoxin system HicB family antitoxin [Luteitalea sp.]|nr:type II toxin-antitoxin system HicB family antitoxin [Luteitalea sp.]